MTLFKRYKIVQLFDANRDEKSSIMRNSDAVKSQYPRIQNIIKFINSTEHQSSWIWERIRAREQELSLDQVDNGTDVDGSDLENGMEYPLEDAILIALILRTYDDDFIQHVMKFKPITSEMSNDWLIRAYKELNTFKDEWESVDRDREWRVLVDDFKIALKYLSFPNASLRIDHEIISGASKLLALPEDVKLLIYKKIRGKLDSINKLIDEELNSIDYSEKRYSEIDRRSICRHIENYYLPRDRRVEQATLVETLSRKFEAMGITYEPIEVEEQNG